MCSLKQEVVIVTGGNAGIGFGSVKGLASKGATVIIASRNQERVNEAVAMVQKLHPGANVEAMVLNLSSYSSIDRFVAEVTSRFTKVDVLINNAGLGMIPFAKTEQGFEPTLGTNVMGTAYLTNSLLPLLSASSAGRVVFLGALPVNMVKQKEVETYICDVGGEKLTGCTFETYGVSKLFTCLYAYELHQRLAAHNNAANNNTGSIGFATWSFIPASRHNCRSCALVLAVMATTGTVTHCGNWRKRRVATNPSITGICMSIKTRS